MLVRSCNIEDKKSSYTYHAVNATHVSVTRRLLFTVHSFRQVFFALRTISGYWTLAWSDAGSSQFSFPT